MKKNIILLLLFMTQLATAQIPDVLKNSIHERVDKGHMPSVAIGIIDSSGMHFYSYGKTSKDGKEVNEKTIFEIGSISKVFTSLLLAEMVTEGKMKLEDPIDQYFPDLQIPNFEGTKITLKDLSTQYSGLPRLPDNIDLTTIPDNPYLNYDGKKLLAFLEKYKLNRKPGTVYEYSNYATGLLGFILGKENKTSYENAFKEKIGKWFDAKNTTMTLSEKQQTQMAIGHDLDTPVCNWDFDALAGAGAWRSNVEEMLQFLSLQLELGKGERNAAVKLSQKLQPYSQQPMGLGWHFYNENVLWHNGGTGGFSSFCGIDLEKNIGIIVLTNSTTSVDDLGLRFLDEEYKISEFVKIATVEEADLKALVGEYSLTPAFTFTVTNEGNKLFVQLTGQPAFRVFPISKNHFFLNVVAAEIEFLRDENGQVKSLVLNQNGMKQEAKKKK